MALSTESTNSLFQQAFAIQKYEYINPAFISPKVINFLLSSQNLHSIVIAAYCSTPTFGVVVQYNGGTVQMEQTRLSAMQTSYGNLFSSSFLLAKTQEEGGWLVWLLLHA